MDQALGDAVSGAKEYDVTYRIVLPDDSQRVIHALAEVVRDEAGKPVMLRGTVHDITERERAEDAVRAEKTYTESIIRSMAGMLVVISPDGTIATVNAATCRSLGYLEEDLIGQPATLLFEEENDDELPSAPSQHALPVKRTVLRRLAEEGSVSNIEKTLRTKGGERVPVLLSGSVMLDNQDTIRGIVCVALDITERKRAEDALRESEERLRLAQESGHIGTWDLDPATREVKWTSELETLYGVEPGSIKRFGDFTDLVHPDDREIVRAIWDKAVGGPPVFDFEFRILRQDGETRWMYCRGGSICDGEGKAIRVFGVNIDITDRKRAEAALRESEERFRSLIETAPEAIFVQNAGRFTYLNPAACRLFGASRPEDLLGKEFMERMAPEHRHAIRERIRFQQATGMPSPLMEQEYLRLDGSRVSVETAAVSIRYQGEDSHMVIVHDITERERAEAILCESEERLRLAAQAANFGTYSHDFLANEAYWSPEFKALLGLAPDAPCQTDESYAPPGVHPHDRASLAELLRASLDPRGTGLLEAEFRVIHPDESVHWLSGRGRVFFSDESEARSPVRATGTLVDITQRKRMEEELRRAKDFSDHVISHAGAGIAVYDRHLNYVVWNQFMEGLTGMSAEQVLGRNALDVFPHLREHGIDRLLERAIAGETVFSADIPFEVPGAAISGWVTATYGPQRDAEGNVVGVIGVIRDITGRKQAEESLRTVAAATAGSGTGDTFHRGVVSQIAAFLGVSHAFVSEVLVENPNRARTHALWAKNGFLVDTEFSLAGTLCREVLEQGRFLCETGLQRRFPADDALLELGVDSCVGVRLCDSSGHAIGVLSVMHERPMPNPAFVEGILRAVSARAAAEIERSRMEAALRSSERRQAEAEKLAATGRMAARIAHEINNPLAGIKNAYRLIQDAVPRDHPDRDMVERIDREIDRISKIVLQMYTLYSPKADQNTEAVVVDVVQDVLSMLEPMRRESEVQFDATGVPSGLSVCAPEGGLNQIVFNLLTNAIEASPPGGVVAISAALDKNRPDLVRIRIQDWGRGIARDIQPRIVEPFFTSRADEHLKEGLGLGLSVVKSVVDAAGGRIEFESAPGLGTTFRVFLPHCAKTLEK